MIIYLCLLRVLKISKQLLPTGVMGRPTYIGWQTEMLYVVRAKQLTKVAKWDDYQLFAGNAKDRTTTE